MLLDSRIPRNISLLRSAQWIHGLFGNVPDASTYMIVALLMTNSHKSRIFVCTLLSPTQSPTA